MTAQDFRKPIVTCILVVLAVFATLPRANAAYPVPQDDYLNDFAGVISDVDASRIREMFKRLEKQTGIEAVVVTVNSIADYGTGDATIKDFATALGNKWGVGHKKSNDGIVMLVAVKDRNCWIATGTGYPSEVDHRMKKVIDNRMTPYFKTDDYSRGIYEGSVGVIEAVTKKISWWSYHKWHIIIGVVIAACVFAGISCMASGKRGWGWAFFVAAGILLAFLIRNLLRGRSRSGFGGGGFSGGGAGGSW